MRRQPGGGCTVAFLRSAPGPAAMFLAASLLSWAGFGGFSLAATWLVQRLTGSPAAVAGLVAAFNVPGVLVPLLGGVLIDRSDRRLLARRLELFRAAGILLLPLLAWWARLLPSHVYAAAFATTAAYMVFAPALSALLPEVVPARELLRVNSAWHAVVQVATMAAQAGAGLAIEAVSMEAVLAGSAACHAGAALLLGTLPSPPVRKEGAEPPGSVARLAGGALEGAARVLRSPTLRVPFLASSIPWLAISLANALVPPLVGDALGGTASDLGFIDSSIAMGAVAGGWAVAWLGRRGMERPVRWISVAAVAVANAAFAGSRGVPAAVASGALLGLSTTAARVLYYTHLQREVPAAVLGRAMSAVTFLGSSASALGVLGVGTLAEKTGPRAAFLVVGAAALVASALVFAAFHRSESEPQNNQH